MEEYSFLEKSKPEFIRVGNELIISVDLIASLERSGVSNDELLIYINSRSGGTYEVYFDSKDELDTEFSRIVELLTK